MYHENQTLLEVHIKTGDIYFCSGVKVYASLKSKSVFWKYYTNKFSACLGDKEGGFVDRGI